MAGSIWTYFLLPIALIHLAQALTLLPDAKRTHCKFGLFLFLTVGLYFPRSLILRQASIEPFPQIVHCFMVLIIAKIFTFCNNYVIYLNMPYLFSILILLFSIIIHEVAHGAAANSLGDSTAKHAGRLTLNPIPHLDPIGSVLFPIILVMVGSPYLFGWAKPVPVNPYNLRNPKWDMAKIAIAGPGVNFFVALFFAALIRFIDLPTSLLAIFSLIVLLNILLGIFNLMPVPPLDGSKILFAFFPSLALPMERFGMFLIFGFLLLVFSGIIPLFSIVYSVFGLMVGPEAFYAFLQS